MHMHVYHNSAVPTTLMVNSDTVTEAITTVPLNSLHVGGQISDPYLMRVATPHGRPQMWSSYIAVLVEK